MDRDLRAAAAAVEAAAGTKGWNVRDLAAAADVDPATVTDFLAARRWPRMSTRGALEKALGWPAGSIGAVASGAAAPGVNSSAQDRGGEPDLMAAVDLLTREDREAVLAVVRQLVSARTAQGAPPPTFDLSRVEGLRIAESDEFRTVEERNDLP